jgi:alanine racemase
MDLLTVDLRPLPDAKIGDCVVFWGEELPVDHFLLHNKTFVYDLFIRITARPRVIVKHDQTAPALVKNYQTC